MELGSLWTPRPVHGYILTGNPEGIIHTQESPPMGIAQALHPVTVNRVTCFPANGNHLAIWWLPLQSETPWPDPTPAWSRCLALLPSSTTWVAASPWDGADPATMPEWWNAWLDLLTGWTTARDLRIHWVHPTLLPWVPADTHLVGSYWRRAWDAKDPKPAIPPRKSPRRKKGSPSPEQKASL